LVGCSEHGGTTGLAPGSAGLTPGFGRSGSSSWAKLGHNTGQRGSREQTRRRKETC
jgi:hypothetical protein